MTHEFPPLLVVVGLAALAVGWLTVMFTIMLSAASAAFGRGLPASDGPVERAMFGGVALLLAGLFWTLGCAASWILWRRP